MLKRDIGVVSIEGRALCRRIILPGESISGEGIAMTSETDKPEDGNPVGSARSHLCGLSGVGFKSEGIGRGVEPLAMGPGWTWGIALGFTGGVGGSDSIRLKGEGSGTWQAIS